MFAPLFRISSLLLIAVGLLSGSTGAYALIFQANAVRFFTLMTLGVVLALAGYFLRSWAGELNLVLIRPEDLANDFTIAKALGLGANAAPGVTAAAGALAGALIVLLVGLAGFITAGALLQATVLFGIYGAGLALIKRRALRRGALLRDKDGNYYAAHRRVSHWAVPVIVVAWLIASAPEANPLTLGLIVVGLFFWLGKAFHHVWDVAHTALLALIYGENGPKTIEWGLYQWLRHSRRDLALTSVSYVPERAEATVVGRFERPEELKREMRRLDFLREVVLVSDEGTSANHP